MRFKTTITLTIITLTEREMKVLVTALETAKRAELAGVKEGSSCEADVNEIMALRNKMRDA